MRRPRVIRTTAAASMATAMAVAACSSSAPVRPEYVAATTTLPLQVPPGLSNPAPRPETAIPRLSGKPSQAMSPAELEKPPTVSLETDEIQLEHDGALYWLVIQESQDDVWRQLRAYWGDHHVDLTFTNADLDIMETDWVVPPAVDLPPAQARADLRYKFRVRLEHFTEAGNTEVYLTDRVVERSTTAAGAVSVAPRPSDPQLAAHLLHEMAVSIGGPALASVAVPQVQPQPPDVAAVRVNGELQALQVDKSVDMAWRHVAAAVDRIGYTIVADDRPGGKLLISTGPPRAVVQKRGFLARLFSPGPKTEMKVPVYRIEFTPLGGKAAAAAPRAGAPRAAAGKRRSRGDKGGAGTEEGHEGPAGAASPVTAGPVRVTVAPQSDSGAEAADTSKILQSIYEQLK